MPVPLPAIFAEASVASKPRAHDASTRAAEPARHKGDTTDAEDERVEEEKVTRVWYGWQLIPADAAAAASFCLGVGLLESNRSTGRPLMTLGEVIFLANGPIVHVVHGHSLKAVSSLGMRVLFPLGGHVLGVATGSRTADVFGVVGAGLIASAVDIAFVAFDEPDPPRWARYVPSLTLTRDVRGASAPTLGFAGTL